MKQKKVDDMNIVIVGHVDHGKSTLIGRLLADTNSLPKGKLDQVKETCRKNSKPFEYAFLLDALQDEQAQGITIDAARCFFKTKKRNYIILDAPGHIEFLKNMITGASRAEAAILVIDAKEGVRENSRRHGYMLSMLGIKQVAVIINKMDLVDYSEEVFNQVKEEYTAFLKEINVTPSMVVPISAFEGDNIVTLSERMSWYNGLTILEVLDHFKTQQTLDKQVFRMPVQDVYKFTKNGDDRRIVAGTIETGSIEVGEEVIFYPSGKKSKIKSIEAFNSPKLTKVSAETATGFTLEEQIYITRGEMMSIAKQKKPCVASRLAANVFWLGKKNLSSGKKYFLKIGSAKVKAELESVIKIINSSDLGEVQRDEVECNEVAECIFKLDNPIAFDLVENNATTSRFVLVDQYEISGGGIVLKSLKDKQSNVRDKMIIRNMKWESSEISSDFRSERYCQKPILILVTGDTNTGKKQFAKELEKNLLVSGRYVYYLGIGSYLYGVGADIKVAKKENHNEIIRRFAEVANIMLDAGMILVATASNLDQSDLEIMKTVLQQDMEVIWIGDTITTDINVNMHFPNAKEQKNFSVVLNQLKENGYVFHV